MGTPTPIAPGGSRSTDQPAGYVAYPRVGIPGAGPQVVPKGFNWGAFYFGWIWGLNHRKPILLLMLPVSIVLGLIPIVGIFINLGIQIWVGYQGNQWAWESGRFNTISQMMECEDVWKKWAIALFSLSIVFVVLAVLLPLMVSGGRTTR